MKELSGEERTVIVYESPHRLLKTLQDMIEIMGDIHIVCARELTKKFEEVRREKVSGCIRRRIHRSTFHHRIRRESRSEGLVVRFAAPLSPVRLL